MWETERLNEVGHHYLYKMAYVPKILDSGTHSHIRVGATTEFAEHCKFFCIKHYRKSAVMSLSARSSRYKTSELRHPALRCVH